MTDSTKWTWIGWLQPPPLTILQISSVPSPLKPASVGPVASWGAAEIRRGAEDEPLHHACAGVVGDVLFGDESSGKQRDAHRLKISGAGTAEIDLGPFTGRNFSSLNRQKRGDVIQRAHQRQARHKPDRSNLRRGSKVRFELPKKRDALLRFLVTGVWQPYLHRQHVLVDEAGFHVEQVRKALQQQSCAN